MYIMNMDKHLESAKRETLPRWESYLSNQQTIANEVAIKWLAIWGSEDELENTGHFHSQRIGGNKKIFLPLFDDEQPV